MKGPARSVSLPPRVFRPHSTAGYHTFTASGRRRRQAGWVARVAEYYHDPTAPLANSVRPTAFAIVRDAAGRVLLGRRADTLDWELPGGKVEPGESAVDGAVREVAEETGLLVSITGLSGVYTDPGHVMVYPTGEIRQQFAVCLHAVPVSGRPRADGHEMTSVGWYELEALDRLSIHPSMRLRIQHGVAHPDRVQLV